MSDNNSKNPNVEEALAKHTADAISHLHKIMHEPPDLPTAPLKWFRVKWRSHVARVEVERTQRVKATSPIEAANRVFDTYAGDHPTAYPGFEVLSVTEERVGGLK